MPLTQWPSKLSLALLPTPLQRLERTSARLGGPTIWVKRDDLTGSVLSGNKVRKLEYTLAYALARKYDMLITCGAVQSNHCRATAFAGAQLGLPVALVLRGESGIPDGNLLLDQLAGAKVHCYPASVYQQQLTELLKQTADDYRQKGYKPYIIPTGASDSIGVWGYFTACSELKQDFQQYNIKPDLLVTATGSGGTQTGLTLGCQYFDLDCQVMGMAVCDDASYFYKKVKEDIDGFLKQFNTCFADNIARKIDILTNDHYIGEGYGLVSSEVLNTIAMLAREEGVLLDPVYSGKAFHGLVNEIEQGHLSGMKDVIFIHTGGTLGLFPYRQQFQHCLSSH